MDAFLLDITVVAAVAFCLVALSFAMRQMTYREPRVRPAPRPAPLGSLALRARPVSR
jgi:hypothetical protein